jgi:plastocyanin
MGRRTLPLLLAALAACALIVTACGDDDEETTSAESSEEPATIEVNGEPANFEGTEALTGESIKFEEDDFYFEPTVLTGDAGQKVTLEVFNEGDSEHNLTIEDQGIDEDTEPDGTASIVVEIPDSGLIEFYCSYHEAQNMRGALAVTGSEPKPEAVGNQETTESSGGY